MLMYLMFYGFNKFTHWVSRYDLYSTLHFAPDGVAIRRNRLTITTHRALPAAKFNALYRPPNYGF